MKEIHKADEKLIRLLPPQKAQTGVEYVQTRFILPFTHNEKHYVFNTLTKQCLEGELPASCSSGAGYDDLIEGYFFVPRDRDECSFYENLLALMKAYSRREEIRTYTILPTFACNARCVYCYEEGFVPVTMTPETEEQTIRFILNTREQNKPISIRWFGGEPLLGEKIIDRISLALDEAGVKYEAYMISNGTLITPGIIEKMAGPWKIRNIQISMDGTEEEYKQRKRYIEYKDDYHKVMEAISCMSEAGITVVVRCNVDENNFPGIFRYLEDMKNGVADKKNVAIYFSMLHDVRLHGDELSLLKKIQAARPLIEEAGFKPIYEGVFGLGTRLYYCMADNGFPVIGPDGSLYPCEHCPQECRYGDVWNGTTDPVALHSFIRADKAVGECRNCSLLPLCTPFASCPVKDAQCYGVKQMQLTEALIHMIEQNEGGDSPADKNPSGC